MDRNYIIKITVCRPAASLSARRAWIEIGLKFLKCRLSQVALRKESVDRNFCVVSLNYKEVVALRKESVDRNKCSFGNPYKKP